MKVAGLVQSSCWVGLFSFPAVSGSCTSREEPKHQVGFGDTTAKELCTKTRHQPFSSFSLPAYLDSFRKQILLFVSSRLAGAPAIFPIESTICSWQAARTRHKTIHHGKPT